MGNTETAGILLDQIKKQLQSAKGKLDNKETAGILLDKINGLLKSGKTSLEQQETAGILIQKIREQLGKDLGLKTKRLLEF